MVGKRILLLSTFYFLYMKYINKYMKPTNIQIVAVHFCEEWLNISFKGDIEDRAQVSIFLKEYLDDAKNTYEEVVCEYEAYLWELD